MDNHERNLIARINRRLSRRGETLHKTRDQWVYELGRYYVINDHNWYCGPGRLDSVLDLENYLLQLS